MICYNINYMNKINYKLFLFSSIGIMSSFESTSINTDAKRNELDKDINKYLDCLSKVLHTLKINDSGKCFFEWLDYLKKEFKIINNNPSKPTDIINNHSKITNVIKVLNENLKYYIPHFVNIYILDLICKEYNIIKKKIITKEEFIESMKKIKYYLHRVEITKSNDIEFKNCMEEMIKIEEKHKLNHWNDVDIKNFNNQLGNHLIEILIEKLTRMIHSYVEIFTDYRDINNNKLYDKLQIDTYKESLTKNAKEELHKYIKSINTDQINN